MSRGQLCNPRLTKEKCVFSTVIQRPVRLTNGQDVSTVFRYGESIQQSPDLRIPRLQQTVISNIRLAGAAQALVGCVVGMAALQASPLAPRESARL